MAYPSRVFTRVFVIFLAALLLLPGFIPAAATGTRSHYDLIVSDTLRYGNTSWTDGSGRQESHFLSFSPGGDIRPIVSAGAHVFGASNINTVINHAQARGHNVIGGVNADFFSFQTGIMEGIYISNGRLKSSHHGRSAVFFREDGSAFVGQPSLSFTLEHQGRQLNIPFFNKLRQPHWFYLYDEHFSATTRTNTPGREVLFRVLGGQMAVGGSVSLEVVSVLDSAGAVSIPQNHMILSIDRENPNLGLMDDFLPGSRATLRIGSNDGRIAEALWATGSGDILVYGGNRTSGWDPGVGGTHPRTALGIRPDGSILLYTVDGRQPNHSMGLTLSGLADEMVALGASYVVNLDGGGSTSFSFRYPGTQHAAVMNRPSGGALRNCATFILLTAPHGDGQPAHIQFSPSRATVLGGSFVRAEDLAERITLTDSGYHPLNPALGYTSYEAPPALGRQEADGFRGAVANESGRLTIHAANGARGHMDISLLERPDSVDVRLAGEALSSLHLAHGDQVRLSYHALVGGAEIISSRDVYRVELTGDIASLDESGLLTISGESESRGSITVSANNVQQTISLSVARYFVDTDNHWAQAAIGQMRDAGVITGIATNRGTHFFPDQQISRAQFAAMLARLLELDTAAYSLTGQEFLDSAELPRWALPYIAAVFHEGYMTGRAVPGGVRFDPEASITRAEAFTTLGRLFPHNAPLSVLDRFIDADDIPQWARGEIAKLVQLDFLTGTGDGRLSPQENLTRAEAATILARISPVAAVAHTARGEPAPPEPQSPALTIRLEG